MTIEEAIKDIKENIQPSVVGKSLDMAIVALEKQIPKKPITYTHTHRADCPNCRVTVRGIDKPFGDYCSKCGIKLDWSE